MAPIYCCFLDVKEDCGLENLSFCWQLYQHLWFNVVPHLFLHLGHVINRSHLYILLLFYKKSFLGWKGPWSQWSQLWHGRKQGGNYYSFHSLQLFYCLLMLLVYSYTIQWVLHYTKQPKYAILASCSMTFLEVRLIILPRILPDSNLQISDSNKGSSPRWVRKKPSRYRSVDERILCFASIVL